MSDHVIHADVRRATQYVGHTNNAGSYVFVGEPEDDTFFITLNQQYRAEGGELLEAQVNGFLLIPYSVALTIKEWASRTSLSGHSRREVPGGSICMYGAFMEIRLDETFVEIPRRNFKVWKFE